MTPAPDHTALLARIRQLEGIVTTWGSLILHHEAEAGYCRGMRDRAQAELATARQDLARLEQREGVTAE